MAPVPGIAMCQSVVVIFNHEQKEPPTMKITTIGLDLAKNVFQVVNVGGLRRFENIGESRLAGPSASAELWRNQMMVGEINACHNKRCDRNDLNLQQDQDGEQEPEDDTNRRQARLILSAQGARNQIEDHG